MNKNYHYIILYKPFGVLSQFTSEEGQRTLSEFNLPSNVYAAGRLDKDSEGMLLLTNDGPFINEFLTHHPRRYFAQVEKIPSDNDLEGLAAGVKLKDGLTKPCQIKRVENTTFLPERNPPIRIRKSIPTAWIELTLTEGRNRQVRRMTAHIGHPTLRLVRSGMGKLKLEDTNLSQPGMWIEVSKNQLI